MAVNPRDGRHCDSIQGCRPSVAMSETVCGAQLMYFNYPGQYQTTEDKQKQNELWSNYNRERSTDNNTDIASQAVTITTAHKRTRVMLVAFRHQFTLQWIPSETQLAKEPPASTRETFWSGSMSA